jgi:hypothetical protein
MSNRFGQAYGLTLMSPILGGADAHGMAQDVALRRELRALNALPASPFAEMPTTHLARWVAIDEAPFEGGKAKIDHFASKYLLFTSNFDGGAHDDDKALGDYLELMRTRIPGTIERLYRHCVGFPGIGKAAAFDAYMKQCQVPTSFLFGAYAEDSVEQVLRALDAQRRMSAFVAAQQAKRLPPEQLQQQFSAFMAELRNATTPRPGTL